MDSRPFTVEPMGAGAILDRAFKTYRNNFLSILLFSVLIGGFPSILNYLFTLFSGGFAFGGFDAMTLFDMIQESMVDPQLLWNAFSPYLMGQSVIIYLLATLVLTPLSLAGAAAVTTGYFRGETRSAGEWFSYATKRLKDIFLLTLCQLVTGLIAVVAVIILMIVASLLMALLFNIPGLGILFAIAYIIFFVCLAVAFAVVIGMSYVVLMTEEQRNFSAIRRALGLVFSKFWKCVGITLLAAIIIGVIDAVISTVFGMASMFGSAGAAFGSLLGTASGLVLNAVSGIVTALLYLSIRIEKEGYDIELRSGSLHGYDTPETGPGGFSDDPWKNNR